MADRIDFTLIEDDETLIGEKDWERAVNAGVDAARAARKFLAQQVGHLPLHLRSDAIMIATEVMQAHLTFVHRQAAELAAIALGEEQATVEFERINRRRKIVREGLAAGDLAYQAWATTGEKETVQ